MMQWLNLQPPKTYVIDHAVCLLHILVFILEDTRIFSCPIQASWSVTFNLFFRVATFVTLNIDILENQSGMEPFGFCCVLSCKKS